VSEAHAEQGSVAVSIVSTGEADKVRSCLASIIAQDFEGEIHVVVTENGVRDGTADVTRALRDDALVIATVDKLAQLPWRAATATLFGLVDTRCPRHGWQNPDFSSFCGPGGHPANAARGLDRAVIAPAMRLRPPDLIIQDELHLITGALGTTVGLFEAAIDVLSGWRTSDGKPVRPLVVASTATARNASDQVRALYGRGATIFPPQVLEVGKTFFAKELPVTEKTPGRRYLGISTTGIRLTTAEIRIAEILMAAGQLLFDRSPDHTGSDADPYLTLVSYFSSTRELAGMARYMGDDIQTALNKRRPWSRLPRRTGTDFGHLNVAELTSRVSSADITATLDQMGIPIHRHRGIRITDEATLTRMWTDADALPGLAELEEPRLWLARTV